MLLRVLTLAVLCTCTRAWMTMFGAPFRVVCPSGNSLVALTSVHSSFAEDRIWDFRCAQTGVTEECEWNTDVNDLDEPMLFQCGDNGVVRGITSYFSRMNRDRRFSFLCCGIRGSILTSCAFTDFLNDFDGALNFIAPEGQVIKGVFSLHDNEREDRIWRVEVCEVRRNFPAVTAVQTAPAVSAPSQPGDSLDSQTILSNFPPPSALPQNGESSAGATNQIQPVSGTTNQVQQVSGTTNQVQQVSGTTNQVQQVSGTTNQIQPVWGTTNQVQQVSGTTNQIQPVSGTTNQVQPNQANFQNTATSGTQSNTIMGGNSNQNAVQGNRLSQPMLGNGMMAGMIPNRNRFMPNQQLMAMGRFPGIQPNLNPFFFSG